MTRTSWKQPRLLLLLLLPWLYGCDAPKQSEMPISVFTKKPSDSTWKGAEGTAKRSEIVQPNSRLLHPAPLPIGTQLTIDLFGSAITATVFDSFININQTVASVAHINHTSYGRLFLACTDGQLRGSLFLPERQQQFTIEYNSQTQHYAFLELNRDFSYRQTPQPAPKPLPVPETIASPTDALTTETEQQRIDFMVVYANDALTELGSHAEVLNRIANGLSYANDALKNSDARIRLRLVHTAHLTDYSSGERPLAELCSTNGPLAHVHQWRDQYGADLVNMMVTGVSGNSRTLRTPLGDEQAAFSIGGHKYYDTSKVLIHEMGHNLGCHHNKYQPIFPGPNSSKEISFSQALGGWHWTGDDGFRYCSIMTYNQPGPNNLDYIEIPLFSNPNLSHHGQTTGDPEDGNNVLALHAFGKIVAEYRTAKPTPTTK